MADLVPMSQAATTSLVTTLQNTDLFALAREDNTSETGYRSKVARVDAMAKKVVNETDYSQLQTTDKKIIGAINEVNGKAKENLFDLTDTTITTPSNADLLAYDSGSNKWVNTNLKGNATGAIATFSNGGNGIPCSVECEINPTQSGSGTPSPSNPRPISGVSNLDIYVTGKNLFNKATIVSNKWFSDNGSEVAISGRFYSALIPVLPSTDYYLTNVVGAGSFVSTVHFASDLTIVGAKNITGSNTQSGYITTFSNSAYMLINGFLSDIDTAQVVKGNTATTYEPFGTTHTLNLGETVYGGVARNDGTGTKTYGEADLGALSWAYTSSGNRFYTGNLASLIKSPTSDDSVVNAICEQFGALSLDDLTSGSTDNVFACGTTGNLSFRCTTYGTDATAFKNAMSGVKLVYELATEQALSFTGEKIPTLSGNNNIYHNGNGDIEVNYFTDKADNIADLIKAFL